MDEKELIQKIQGLREITPRKEWVFLTKKEILGEEPSYKEKFAEILEIFPRVIFQRKLAYAVLSFLFIVVGTFGFAQQTLPGDLLFTLKKVTEQSQIVFLSDEGQTKYNLEIAQRRLEDLNKLAESGKVKNMAPTITEFQSSISEAAKSLVKGGSQDNAEAIKEIALDVKKLAENKSKIESLGVKIEETEELNDALAPLVQKEITDLEKSSLTEVQQKLLDWAKIDAENGDYSAALIKIWQISNLNNG